MNARKRIFGVVLPIPAPLARLANRVRRSYDPNFRFIGPHVTVLPPRSLPLTRRQVLDAVGRVAERTPPLRLGLGKVDSFLPVRPVVFLGFGRGIQELRRLHRRLARDPLRAPESFPFVPHITLGQELDEARFRKALALSRKLFSSPGTLRSWPADSLLVVERPSRGPWITLNPLCLSGLPPSKGRTRRVRRG